VSLGTANTIFILNALTSYYRAASGLCLTI